MQLYYTFKRPKTQPLKDYSKTQTWSSDFPTSVTLVEMKESLGLWHSLDPLNLTMFNPYRSSITDDEGDFTVVDNCAEFPLIVEIESQETSPEITSSEIPISRVLQYLVTGDKKYKPIVYEI
jgi:hypothetical protein